MLENSEDKISWLDQDKKYSPVLLNLTLNVSRWTFLDVF